MSDIRESVPADDPLIRMINEIERDANILRAIVLIMSDYDQKQAIRGIVDRLDALSEEMCELEDAADA